jgi:DNA-binding IclR family transcriptional regulator
MTPPDSAPPGRPRAPDRPEPLGAHDSPTLRAFAIVEAIGRAGRALPLSEVVALTGLPKPTAHRMLGQLAESGLLVRLAGAGYAAGPRLSQLGRELVAGDARQPERRAILQRLVERVGETCNFTMLDGAEVVYLDRVETASPLRVNLQPGSRVPVHCSASGKLLLALLPPPRCARVLDQLDYTRYTPNTRASRSALEAELASIRERGYATDDEEFLEGLVCVAVPVRDDRERAWAAVAIHGPAARLPLPTAIARLPELREAAAALADSHRDAR